MKTIALITEKNGTNSAQWQFDKVMAAVAYDLDLTIIFANDGVKQLLLNPAWKCLKIYGFDSIYVVSNQTNKKKEFLINVDEINLTELKLLITGSQLLL